MSAPATSATPAQGPVLAVAAAVALALLVAAHRLGSPRLALAAAIGLFAGVALYHASFGFTSAWRRFLFERRGAGLRAQIGLVLLTCAVSFPLVASGEFLGRPVSGSVAPFGFAAALGAFLFGVGMQFGGSCASGTLFTAGGGNTRMLATLAGFIAGSVIATAHLPWWWSLPALPAFSLVDHYGAVLAFAVTAAGLGGLFLYSRQRELSHFGSLEPPPENTDLLRGPWPKSWGCVALAMVGIATLLVLSRPWGITGAFALWGAKLSQGAGVAIETWPYWQNRLGWLNRSVFADATSVMNFGIVVGALAAAAAGGRFAPTFRVPPGQLLLSLCGGLLMGYGARLAYGCNIGAYLGGVISGSLHGWGWLVFGFLGSWLGGLLLLRAPAVQPDR